MRFSFFRSFVPLLLLLFLITSCANLPDYAKPRMGKSYDNANEQEVIHYRTLKVTDFRATSLQNDLQLHRNKLNAHTRVIIRPTYDSKLAISSSKGFDQVVYHGRVTPLKFEACMLPHSSWWNSQITDDLVAYVLQHEQIHFALMEITARRMTEKVAGNTGADFSAFGASRQEVQKFLERKLSEFIDANVRAVMNEHTNFDEETSMIHDPMAQKKWYKRVTDALNESEETISQ